MIFPVPMTQKIFISRRVYVCPILLQLIKRQVRSNVRIDINLDRKLLLISEKLKEFFLFFK